MSPILLYIKGFYPRFSFFIPETKAIAMLQEADGLPNSLLADLDAIFSDSEESDGDYPDDKDALVMCSHSKKIREANGGAFNLSPSPSICDNPGAQSGHVSPIGARHGPMSTVSFLQSDRVPPRRKLHQARQEMLKQY